MTRTWDEMRGEIIDSRDIIDRIDELEDLITFDEDGEGIPAPDSDPDEVAELSTLRTIALDGSTAADWLYGETFIPESEWIDYAQQLAEDIGAIDANAAWPLTYIDWGAAADALRQDYTSYTFDGIDYLARS